MIKTLIICVLSSVLAIGIYEKYVLGLDRSERNKESSELIESVTDHAEKVVSNIPKLNNKDDFKALLDSAGEKSIELIDVIKQETNEFSDSRERRAYR